MLAATVPLSFLLPAQTLLNLLGISLAGAIAYTSCLALETNRRFVELKQAMLADLRVFVG